MTQTMNHAEYQKLLNLSIDMGQLLLQAGAEISRVEETIQLVLYAYGIKHVDVFAIQNNIIVSITVEDDDCYTRQRRIYTKSTNYQMIEDVNALSRYICAKKPSVTEIAGYIKQIRHRKVYPEWLMVVGYAGVAYAFTMFFGGNVADGVVATLAGAISRVAAYQMEKLETNSFVANLFNSFIVSLIALLAVECGMADHSDKVIIGTLMNLVPGVAITNSMRDVIAGDLMAGMMKGTEALIVALALALGTGVALTITGGWIG